VRKGVLRVALATLLAIASLVFAPAGALAAGCGSTAQPTRIIYLPNITKTLGGPSGWVTPFIVQNVGIAPTDLEVSFYRFSDGALVTCRRVSALQPFRSFADYPNADVDLPADSQFAVVVRSFGSDVIAVVNEHQGAGPAAEALSYVGLSSGAQTLALPYVAKFASGWLVTFVMQNLGTRTANVTARFVSLDGTQTATLTRAIAPGASQFVNPVSEPSLVAGSEYSVMLTSDQPIAAIANAHNDAPGAVSPMGFSYNAAAVAASEQIYVPSVARNSEGRTTRLLVQNAGTSPVTPSLVFQRGPATAPVTAPPLAPGRSWSFDARSLAEGDWSLTVSGGPLAVLAITTSSTTAMGFIGTASPGNRAYLPNITRTLGGPSGWTTPILLQSVGATTATLRWYRFADGLLITRQQVIGLLPGATTRIDPRGVPGLLDDTQYAVVVDAQGGNVVATVLELSLEGGDGAMAYEGFKASVPTTPVATMVVASAPKTTVYTGATVQASAVVKDQFDNTLTAPITWTVSPTSLGEIGPTGLFMAAEGATGVATLTATSAGASATVAISVAQRPIVDVSGILFALDGSGRADVYTEPSITGSDASTVVVEVDQDVVRIEGDYGRAFATKPRLFFLRTTATYANALQAIFEYDADQARELATTTAGLYLRSPNAVLIDWSKVRGIQPLTAPRHELTHMMEQQLAGAAFIPAWFNEGNARLEEFTEPSTAYLAMLSSYGAASMAATGTLFTLAELRSQGAWNARDGVAGQFQYHAGAQAVRQLRDRVGMTGTLRILDAMNAGLSFEESYAFVAGEPFDAFAASYATRVRALAPTYPGIATAPDTLVGPGLSIMFYGFRPGSPISYSVTGAGASSNNSTFVTQYGTFFSFLGTDWPAGTYTITVTSSSGTVSTVATKTR
jgi:hypothetical protein